MKLPAAIVKTWSDIQLNFDALAKQDGFTFAQAIAGAWPTVAPGATTGTPFTLPRAGLTLIECSVTGYINVAGIGLQIDVYLDGVLSSSMFMKPTITPNVRLTPPTARISKTLTRGTHYVALRQTSGVSDTDDNGTISVVQP